MVCPSCLLQTTQNSVVKNCNDHLCCSWVCNTSRARCRQFWVSPLGTAAWELGLLFQDASLMRWASRASPYGMGSGCWEGFCLEAGSGSWAFLMTWFIITCTLFYESSSQIVWIEGEWSGMHTLKWIIRYKNAVWDKVIRYTSFGQSGSIVELIS